MYSRNYGRGEIPAKITPPPAYSGSAIQSNESAGVEQAKEETKNQPAQFPNFSQSIPLPKEECAPEPVCECECREHDETEVCKTEKKEKGSFLSDLLPDIATEDLVLIGIVAALAFDLADRDILLVALVVAVVLM